MSLTYHKTILARTVAEMVEKSADFENECNKYGYRIINIYGSRFNDFFGTFVLIYVYEKSCN